MNSSLTGGKNPGMTENPIVLDASAVLAYLNQEAGSDAIEEVLASNPLMNTVNVAEVVGKLTDRGMPLNDIRDVMVSLNMLIVPFDEQMAETCGRLQAETRRFGLSLGDRACLALAVIRHCPVITCDAIWQSVPLPVAILLAR